MTRKRLEQKYILGRARRLRVTSIGPVCTERSNVKQGAVLFMCYSFVNNAWLKYAGSLTAGP